MIFSLKNSIFGPGSGPERTSVVSRSCFTTCVCPLYFLLSQTVGRACAPPSSLVFVEFGSSVLRFTPRAVTHSVTSVFLFRSEVQCGAFVVARLLPLQIVVTDEEIERDILEAYRPLSNPDGMENWTCIGPYSVVFRRLLGQREVWVETPVYHFSTTANAMKVDKAARNQSYYGDLGGLRRWFKERSSAPRVRFGNTTEASFCFPMPFW